MAATFHQEPNGSITASWPYEVAGRPVVLYANFVELNGAFDVGPLVPASRQRRRHGGAVKSKPAFLRLSHYVAVDVGIVGR